MNFPAQVFTERDRFAYSGARISSSTGLPNLRAYRIRFHRRRIFAQGSSRRRKLAVARHGQFWGLGFSAQDSELMPAKPGEAWLNHFLSGQPGGARRPPRGGTRLSDTHPHVRPPALVARCRAAAAGRPGRRPGLDSACTLVADARPAMPRDPGLATMLPQQSRPAGRGVPAVVNISVTETRGDQMSDELPETIEAPFRRHAAAVFDQQQGENGTYRVGFPAPQEDVRASPWLGLHRRRRRHIVTNNHVVGEAAKVE